MSRIGKKAIIVPSDVIISIENNLISIKGPYGILERPFLPLVSINIEDNILLIKSKSENKENKSYHGLIRNLIWNMIQGVKFQIKTILLTEGVGYKFQINKDTLILNVGFTHSVNFIIPEDITLKLESQTKLIISGIDKEKVTLFASKIYNIKPPEPYKGKGILYEGQKVVKKAGKTKK